MNIETAIEMVEITRKKFGLPPVKVEANTRLSVRGGQYDPATGTIELALDLCDVFDVLHELAHHAHMTMPGFKPEQRHHGPAFTQWLRLFLEDAKE